MPLNAMSSQVIGRIGLLTLSHNISYQYSVNLCIVLKIYSGLVDIR